MRVMESRIKKLKCLIKTSVASILNIGGGSMEMFSSDGLQVGLNAHTVADLC